MTAALVTIADVTGSGSASDVSAGAVLTLVIPLLLLAIVLAWWWLAARRGWPTLPTARHPAPPRHRWHLRHRHQAEHE
jgi:hypothetical protein